MLVPHLYFNGKSEEAIAQYVKAFGAEVKVLLRHSEDEPQKGVLHAEIDIHGQRIMLNDNDLGPPALVVIYNNEEELMCTYEILKEGGQVTAEMIETDYSPCVVGFRDRFGIDWAFMVGKS